MLGEIHGVPCLKVGNCGNELGLVTLRDDGGMSVMKPTGEKEYLQLQSAVNFITQSNGHKKGIYGGYDLKDAARLEAFAKDFEKYGFEIMEFVAKDAN